jgi:hypothetical protein
MSLDRRLASVETLEGWKHYEARRWSDAVREKGLLMRNLSPEARAAVEELDVANGLVLRAVIR